EGAGRLHGLVHGAVEGGLAKGGPEIGHLLVRRLDGADRLLEARDGAGHRPDAVARDARRHEHDRHQPDGEVGPPRSPSGRYARAGSGLHRRWRSAARRAPGPDQRPRASSASAMTAFPARWTSFRWMM